MHRDPANPKHKTSQSQIVGPVAQGRELVKITTAETPRETPAQLAVSDGIPAWVGASAALAVVGLPLLHTVGIGLASGFAFTLMNLARINAARARSH
jgi:hypothetical protein